MSLHDMHSASRDVHRASMNEYGPEMAWLADPDLIPEAAVASPGFEDSVERRSASLALWMVQELGDWTIRVHDRVDVEDIYSKRGLRPRECVMTMAKFHGDPYGPYKPGMFATAAIVAAIPYIAAREGREKEEWAEIAGEAEAFGYEISLHGTDAQASIHQWLRAGSARGTNTLNVARLKLDKQTGITTTTPLEDVVGTARTVAGELDLMGLGENVCIAHQARSPVEGSKSLFGAVWASYAGAAERLVYPIAEIDPTQIPPEEEPWNIPDMADYMARNLIADHEALRRQGQMGLGLIPIQ